MSVRVNGLNVNTVAQAKALKRAGRFSAADVQKARQKLNSGGSSSGSSNGGSSNGGSSNGGSSNGGSSNGGSSVELPDVNAVIGKFSTGEFNRSNLKQTRDAFADQGKSSAVEKINDALSSSGGSSNDGSSGRSSPDPPNNTMPVTRYPSDTVNLSDSLGGLPVGGTVLVGIALVAAIALGGDR